VVQIFTSLALSQISKLRADGAGAEEEEDGEGENEIYVRVNIILFSEPILLQFSEIIGVHQDNVYAKWRFVKFIAAKARPI
ncbi:MAG: hypothetical protein GY821_13190, partial [Gammaproteobacteria bacterium]|nr:hypothetical protein [Gammaproteobacteria bacterium]